MNILKFDLFFEATISNERTSSGITYRPNAKGISKGLPSSLVLTPINNPSLESIKYIKLINSTSFIDNKSPYNANILQNYAIYKGNDKIYYGIKYGKNSLIIQQEKTGSSKRGNYIKELIFCMQLYKSLSDKGWLNDDLMIYNGDNSYTSKDEQEIFVDENLQMWYNENPSKMIPLINQCELLMGYLGKDKCLSMSKIVNSNNNYSLLKLVSKIKKGDIDSFNISKWNPSDIWLVFDGFDDTTFFQDFSGDLGDLNAFLDNNIDNDLDYHIENFVGISLKLPIDEKVYIEIKNKGDEGKESYFRYAGKYSFNLNNITVVLPYTYRKYGSSKTQNSVIEIRKFDTSNVTVVPEVKTSDNKQIGGKANVKVALSNKDSFNKYESFKRLVYDKVDPYNEVRQFLQSIDPNTVDSTYAYNDMFRVLNNCNRIIGHTQSSQLLGLYMLYLIFENGDINKSIESIVKYGKSISDWSSAYIVLK